MKQMPCPICGKIRFVSNVKSLCRSCWAKPRRGNKAANWKGGRWHNSEGYILTWIASDDFFASMGKRLRSGKSLYVLEHRLIMARHLGRCLQSWEIAHHKNGIKDDNRLENLELSSFGSHTLGHNKGYRDGYQKGLIDGRDEQIQGLKKELKFIQWQLQELQTRLARS